MKRNPTKTETIRDLLTKQHASVRLWNCLQNLHDITITSFRRWYPAKRLLCSVRGFGKLRFQELNQIFLREFGVNYMDMVVTPTHGRSSESQAAPPPIPQKQEEAHSLAGLDPSQQTTFNAGVEAVITGLLDGRKHMRNGDKNAAMSVFRATHDLYGLLLVSLGAWLSSHFPKPHESKGN